MSNCIIDLYFSPFHMCPTNVHYIRRMTLGIGICVSCGTVGEDGRRAMYSTLGLKTH